MNGLTLSERQKVIMEKLAPGEVFITEWDNGTCFVLSLNEVEDRENKPYYQQPVIRLGESKQSELVLAVDLLKKK